MSVGQYIVAVSAFSPFGGMSGTSCQYLYPRKLSVKDQTCFRVLSPVNEISARKAEQGDV